ncbi:MAG: SLC13 family permease [Verrucomicrobiia bacterium]
MGSVLRLLGGPLAGVCVGLATHAFGLEEAAALTAGITTWTAVWWIFEPVPLGVAALLPITIFPLLGILSHVRVGEAVGNKLVLLLLGSYMMSTAIEKAGAHRRLALGMLKAIGGDDPRRIVFGFMLASAVLSGWISNTATVLMLLPVALAVVQQDRSGKIAVPLLLGLAYACNVGGLATPIGTPPNPIALGAYEEFLAKPEKAALIEETGARPMTFARWMALATPLTLMMLPVIWWSLTRALPREGRIEIEHPGPWRAQEIRVLVVFGLVIIAWVTRTFPAGGWSQWWSLPGAWDSDVALLAVIVLAMIPNGAGGRLLDWQTAVQVPWNLILLVGAGITIGYAFEASGLSQVLAQGLVGVAGQAVIVQLFSVVGLTALATELMQNTAVAALVMPILSAAALDLVVDPLYMMMAAALASSCAFMLPIATGPNAIVFGSGRISIAQMLKEGFLLNLVAIPLVAGILWVYWRMGW